MKNLLFLSLFIFGWSSTQAQSETSLQIQELEGRTYIEFESYQQLTAPSNQQAGRRSSSNTGGSYFLTPESKIAIGPNGESVTVFDLGLIKDYTILPSFWGATETFKLFYASKTVK